MDGFTFVRSLNQHGMNRAEGHEPAQVKSGIVMPLHTFGTRRFAQGFSLRDDQLSRGHQWDTSGTIA